jgi:tape measure domain-containing protein
MSSEVDNRIVKMTFDNEQFERGVSKSMSTLDKLEEKLQFSKSASGLKNLQNSINDISFNRFTDAIEGINSRLSATGVMAATVVSRITNSLIDGALQIERATIGQIKSGGWNRAMNIENAKFSIEGLKEDWNELYKAMDYAVTGTAYGIDQAATAAASLVASGVDYLEVVEKSGDTNVTAMHKALRAISGVAAQTNSDFQSISRIFTTVAGQGRLMGDQLNQLAARGMNAAAKLGEALGMSEADVRAAVSAGAIDFETFAFAMDDAFGEHATDANKTFTGSLSNMKAALSRFGAVFATPVIQKTNKFFIALTDRIKEMKNAISDVTKNGEILEEHLESHFAQMWQELINLADTLTHKIDLTWFWNVADAADKATVKIRDLLSTLNSVFNKEAEGTEAVAKKTYDLSKITTDELKLAEEVIQGNYGNGAKRVKALGEAAGKLGLDPVKIQEYVNLVAGYGYSFDKAGIKIQEFTDEEEELSDEEKSHLEVQRNLEVAFHKFGIAISNIKDIFSTFSSMIKAETYDNFFGILEAISDILRYVATDAAFVTTVLRDNVHILQPLASAIANVKNMFDAAHVGIWDFMGDIATVVQDTIRWWTMNGELEYTIENIADIVLYLGGTLRNIGITIKRLVKSVFTALLRVLSPSRLTGVLANFADGVYGLSEKFMLTEEGAEVLTDILERLFTVVQDVVVSVGDFVSTMFMAFGAVKDTDDEAKKAPKIIQGIGTGFEIVLGILSKFVDIVISIPSLITKLSEALSKNEGVQRLKKAVTTLWETMGIAIDEGLKPFKQAIGDMEGTDASEVTIEKIAEAIGWFADKLAFVLEKIPEFTTTVSNFFDTIKTKVTEAWEWLDDIIDFDSLKEKIDGYLDTGEAATTGDRIKAFFKLIGDTIRGALEDLDWDSLKNDAMTLSIMAVLWTLVELGDESSKLVRSINVIPTTIGGIFKTFNNLLKSTSSMAYNFGVAALIASIAATIMAITSAIVLLSEIPDDKFEKVSNVVSTITVTVLLFVVAIERIVAHIQQARITVAATQMKLEIIKILASSLSAALLLFAVGAAIYLIAKSLKLIYDILMDDNFDTGKFLIAAGIVVGVLVILGLFALALSGITRFIFTRITNAAANMGVAINQMHALGTTLMGMGIAMAGIGIAVYFIVSAIEKLSISQTTAGAVVGVLALIAALILGMTWSIVNITSIIRSVRVSDILGVAAILFVFTLGLTAILGVILGLSVIVTGASFVGKEKIIEIMLAEVTALIFALSLGVAAILRNMGRMGANPTLKMFGIVLIIASLGAVIVGIGYSVDMLVDAISSMPSDYNGVLSPIDSIVVILTLVLGAAFSLVNVAGRTAISSAQVLGIAALVAAIGSMMVMVSASFVIMGNALSVIKDGQISVVIFTMIGLLSLMILGIVAMIVVSAMLGSTAPAALLAIGTATVMMGATLLIMAAAFYLISQIKMDDKVLKVIGWTLAAFAGIVVAIGLFAALTSSSSSAGTNAVLFATSIAIISASIFIFAAACYVLQQLDTTVLIATAGALLVFIIAIGVFAGVLANITGADKILHNLALVFVAMGASVVLFGVGLLVMNTALKKLSLTIPLFSAALIPLFDVIGKNWGKIIVFLLAFGLALAALTIIVIKLSPILNSLLQTLTVFAQNLLTMIGQGASHVGHALGTAITNIHHHTTPKVRLLVVGLIAALMSALSESGPKVLQTIGKFLVMILDFVSDAVGPIVEKLVVILINIIEGLRKAIQNHSNAIAAALFNLLYALGDIAIAVINQFLKMTVGALMGDTAYDATVGKFFANLQQTARARADMNMETAKAMDAFASGESNAYEDWVKNMREVSKEMKKDETESYLSKIEDKLSGSSIPKSLSQLKEQFGDTFNLDPGEFDIKAEKVDVSSTPNQAIEDMIKKGMGDFDENGDFYRFTAVAKDDVAGAEDAYADANITFPGVDMNELQNSDMSDAVTSMLGDAGMEGGMAYTDSQAIGIASGQSEVVDATNSNIDAQIQAGNDRKGDVEAMGKGLGQSTAKGVSGAYFDVYHSTNDLLDGISTPLKHYMSGTVDAQGTSQYYGFKIGEGIRDGFDESISGWPDALKSQFAQAYTVSSDAFIGPQGYDMNSPSKTTEWWGQMIIAGLTRGIDGSTDDAVMSMENLSAAMTNSFSNPLEYAAKVASGEIAYDPSIRPVLDTSRIASGAYGINSMFDNQNVQLSGFSGKLAADITGLDTTNTQVVNELRSLRSDMNVMTDRMASMQIVMDSGQLVGAIAPGMDNALGRRAVHRGRGN